MAIVSISSPQVTLDDAEGLDPARRECRRRQAARTPAGAFAIIEKDKDDHLSLYDDAWMPNMQRITWNGVALHGGPLPGHAARRLRADALRLCGRAVQQDADRDAGDRSRPTTRARSSFPPGAIVTDAQAIAAAQRVPRRSPARPPRSPKRPTRRRKPPQQRHARPDCSQRRRASYSCPSPALARRSPSPTRRSPPQRRTKRRRGRGAEAEGGRQGRGAGGSSIGPRPRRSPSSTPPPPRRTPPKRPTLSRPPPPRRQARRSSRSSRSRST